jgi:hypothetical protein
VTRALAAALALALSAGCEESLGRGPRSHQSFGVCPTPGVPCEFNVAEGDTTVKSRCTERRDGSLLCYTPFEFEAPLTSQPTAVSQRDERRR